MAVSVMSGVIMAAAVIAVALRLFAASGAYTGRNRALTYILADKRQNSGFTAGRRDIAAVFGLSMAFRLAIFVLSVFAIYVFRDTPFDFGEFIGSYRLWDARHYESIARGGYTYSVTDGDYLTLVFYPLYAWILRFMHIFTRDYVMGGLIASWLLYSGGCCFLYAFMSHDYKKSTAVRAIVFLSVYPHSLFFGTMMTESLMLFNSVAALYFIRKHNWPLSGLFGALAALSRSAGLLVAFPAAAEWFEHYRIAEKIRSKKLKEVFRLFYTKFVWIFLMLAGTGIYLYLNYRVTGNCFKFIEYEEKNWYQGFQYFGKSIDTMRSYFISAEGYTKFAIWLPELIAVAFAFTMLIYGIRRNRNMLSVYLIVYLIVNTGLKWPISVARYLSCAIPVFIALSDFSERHKWSEYLITAVMAAALGVFFTAYFQQRQIL